MNYSLLLQSLCPDPISFLAAGLMQGSFAVITKTVPLSQRPLFFGLFVSAFGISIGRPRAMEVVFLDVSIRMSRRFSRHRTWQGPAVHKMRGKRDCIGNWVLQKRRDGEPGERS
jgi:hypothetical protein